MSRRARDPRVDPRAGDVVYPFLEDEDDPFRKRARKVTHANRATGSTIFLFVRYQNVLLPHVTQRPFTRLGKVQGCLLETWRKWARDGMIARRGRG